MKRYIAIVILGLAFLACSIWHNVRAQTRTDRFQGNVQVLGTQLEVSNATDPLVRATDTTTPVQTKLQSIDTAGVVGTATNHALQIRTNNTSKIYIAAGGDVGIGTTSPAAGLHGVVTNGWFLWASSEADDTDKRGRWGIEHYDVDEEPFLGLIHEALDVNGGVNILSIGGGSAQGNAATAIKFYTAANDTTTTGTERVQINAAGQILIEEGTAALPGIAFVADPDTGFYSAGANVLGISVAGGVDWTIAAAGELIAGSSGGSNGIDLKGNYMTLTEISVPAAPGANNGRLFAKDNGSGKTQLCVIFATGGEQCFATEPA